MENVLRVLHGKDSLTLNVAGMNSKEDHRLGDVPRSVEDCSRLEAVARVAGGLLKEVLLKSENGWVSDPRVGNVVTAGANLAAPRDGTFGRNPDSEVGMADSKINRLVNEVFEKLCGKMEPIAEAFRNRTSVDVEEITPLLGNSDLHSVMSTLLGNIGTISPEECTEMRLSAGGIDTNRRAFIEKFIYSLDRKLRFELFRSAGSRYPEMAHRRKAQYDGDSDAFCRGLHPSFAYSFDDKGLSVGLVGRRHARQEFEPGTEMYFQVNGFSEKIPVSFGNIKMEVDVRNFMNAARPAKTAENA